MLSITKIKSSKSGYGAYLADKSENNAYEQYAREDGAIAPFWFGKASTALGLGIDVSQKSVDALCKGYSPITGAPLVKGAGAAHVVGIDMTFSAPKDVSIAFAAGEETVRTSITSALQSSTRCALEYAQSVAITRHGKGGLIKQLCEGIVASVYTHFASRALDPQLHTHALVFNIGLRKSEKPQNTTWSALEHKAQFEHKMATGALFRLQLAYELKAMGFQIQPDGQYFKIEGIDENLRKAFSTRTQQIKKAAAMQKLPSSVLDAKTKAQLASQTRSQKEEPSFGALMEHFTQRAIDLGISIAMSPGGSLEISNAFKEYEVSKDVFTAGQRASQNVHDFSNKSCAPISPLLDKETFIEKLLESSSVLTRQEILRAICVEAMGVWDARQCLQELDALCASPLLIRLGATGTLTEVYTSPKRLALEQEVSARVQKGVLSVEQHIAPALVEKEFLHLQRDLSAKVGSSVNLDEQKSAALHICSNTGSHAFVEGWAGTGKTTMLKAVANIYKEAGFKTLGTSLSAAASQNLQKETGISSRTIASLLLSIESNSLTLDNKTVVILDEAGMVGSLQFSALQERVLKAGAKLVAVGDSKQLQPIDAGGIFRTLVQTHGAAQITQIQRQKTNFTPLLDYLLKVCSKLGGLEAGIDKKQIKAILDLPDECKQEALAALAQKSQMVAKAFERWDERFNHKWLRTAVQNFATGNAKQALDLMDKNGCVHLLSDAQAALQRLILDWGQSRAHLEEKSMIAATRQEVATLNTMAREHLKQKGALPSAGVLCSLLISEEVFQKELAVGERLVFLQNDKGMGVANGQTGCVQSISGSKLSVKLDEGHLVQVDLNTYAHLDYAYCLTNHKSQGRTFEQAFVYVNPLHCDREWTYVAASRSKFKTTLYSAADALASALEVPSTPKEGFAKLALKAVQKVGSSLLGKVGNEGKEGIDGNDGKEAKSEIPERGEPALNSSAREVSRQSLLDALAQRMSVSHFKATALDFQPVGQAKHQSLASSLASHVPSQRVQRIAQTYEQAQGQAQGKRQEQSQGLTKLQSHGQRQELESSNEPSLGNY